MNRELLGMPQPSDKSSELNSPYKTVDEAANYLRLNPRTLNNMRSAGKGPCFHKHGRRVLYHIDELVRWSSLTKKVMDAPIEKPQGLYV